MLPYQASDPVRIVRMDGIHTTFAINNQGTVSSYIDDKGEHSTLILPADERIVTLIEDNKSDVVFAMSNTGKLYSRSYDHLSYLDYPHTLTALNGSFTELRFPYPIIQLSYDIECGWYYILTSTGLIYAITDEEIIQLLDPDGFKPDTLTAHQEIRFARIYRTDTVFYLLTTTGEVYVHDQVDEGTGVYDDDDNIRLNELARAIPFELLPFPDKIVAILCGRGTESYFLTSDNRLLRTDYSTKFVVDGQIAAIISDGYYYFAFSLTDGTSWIYNYRRNCKKLEMTIRSVITSGSSAYVLTICGKLYKLDDFGEVLRIVIKERVCKVAVMCSCMVVLTESGKVYKKVDGKEFVPLELENAAVDFSCEPLCTMMLVDVEGKIFSGFKDAYPTYDELPEGSDFYHPRVYLE